jgi:hypothetical protein
MGPGRCWQEGDEMSVSQRARDAQGDVIATSYERVSTLVQGRFGYSFDRSFDRTTPGLL